MEPNPAPKPLGTSTPDDLMQRFSEAREARKGAIARAFGHPDFLDSLSLLLILNRARPGVPPGDAGERYRRKSCRAWEVVHGCDAPLHAYLQSLGRDIGAWGDLALDVQGVRDKAARAARAEMARLQGIRRMVDAHAGPLADRRPGEPEPRLMSPLLARMEAMTCGVEAIGGAVRGPWLKRAADARDAAAKAVLSAALARVADGAGGRAAAAVPVPGTVEPDDENPWGEPPS